MGIMKKLSFLKWLDPFTYVDILLQKVRPTGEKKSLADELIYNLAYLVFAFIFAFALYSLLGIGLGTHSPLVVVVGKSMEPTYFEGDVLVLQGVKAQGINAPAVKLENQTLSETPLSDVATPKYYYNSENLLDTKSIEFNDGKSIGPSKSNDVVVYFSSYRSEPVIHRVVAKLEAGDGWYVVTKGDNPVSNRFLDQDCGKIIPQLNYPERPCISLYPAKVSELDGKAIFLIPRIGLVKLVLFDYIPRAIAGK